MTNIGSLRSNRHSSLALTWQYLPTLASLVLYSAACWRFRFIQDDSFISFRYIANALSAHGLVYNAGQQIEGITNLGWVTILLGISRLGIDYVVASQVLGFLCGAAMILVTREVARIVFSDASRVFVNLPVILMACIGALAYWAQAGLETALFGLLAELSLLAVLNRSYLLVATTSLALWIRPDGAAVLLALLIADLVVSKRITLYSRICFVSAVILSLPLAGFRLAYYHSLFPNPAYAKVGFSFDQIIDGLVYAWTFLQQYWVLGIGLVVPCIFYPRLTRNQRIVLLFVFGFLAYVTFVGGDVLKIHRFMLPVVGALSILVTLAIRSVLQFLGPRRELISLILMLTLSAITWFYPLKSIDGYLGRERGLVMVMTLEGQGLRHSDSSDFTVASSTIGALGYSLENHKVIDLVGLADTTIARHPQVPIPGITSTWRERRYNAPYVLEMAPDYIVFSTGLKPSSPAEQALFLYDAFLDSYRSTTIATIQIGNGLNPRPCYVYKRVRPIIRTKNVSPQHPAEFVAAIKQGEELANEGRHKDALVAFDRARALLSGKIYVELEYQVAQSLLQLGQKKDAFELLQLILEKDSLVMGPHRDLYMTSKANGDSTSAAIHRHFLQELSPVDLERADTLVSQVVSRRQKP